MSFDKGSIGADPAKRLRQLADDVCGKHGYARAEDVLVGLIEKDATLVGLAVRRLAREEVRLGMAVRRQRIQGQVVTVDNKRGTAPKMYSKAVAAKCGLAGKFLTWPLSNRKFLADATLDDVQHEAEMYEGQAQGNARNGRFMRCVEKRLKTLKIKEGETVGQVLDDSVLGNLMSKASKG